MCAALHATKQPAQYDYIRFAWADLHGISRSKTVPTRNLAKYWPNGISVFSGVQSFGPRSEMVHMEQSLKRGCCNLICVPDTDTLHTVAWSGGDKYSVGEVLCQTYWPHDGSILEACTRYIAEKQLAHLKNLGYILLSSAEMEFTIFDQKTKEPIFDGNEGFNTATLAEHESLIYDIDDLLFKSGVNLENLQTECGPGQFEFVLSPKMGIKSADNIFIFKNGTREICNQRGLQANFMGKPSQYATGGSSHFNHSLMGDSGEGIFYDPECEDGFSTIAKYWMAGLIKHGPALTALCCPTINCYRRLHLARTPDKANWGIDDRASTYRVKAYGQNNTYFENRLPSSASNPYLVLAGTVAAGIDGIENKLQCPPSKDPKAPKLPFTLKEAMEELKADSYMVNAVGSEFIEWFMTVKDKVEVEKLGDCDIRQGLPEDYRKEQQLYAKYI